MEDMLIIQIDLSINEGDYLNPGYIEFGVVCIDSAIVVWIHSAILQLLLTRRVSYY